MPEAFSAAQRRNSISNHNGRVGQNGLFRETGKQSDRTFTLRYQPENDEIQPAHLLRDIEHNARKEIHAILHITSDQFSRFLVHAQATAYVGRLFDLYRKGAVKLNDNDAAYLREMVEHLQEQKAKRALARNEEIMIRNPATVVRDYELMNGGALDMATLRHLVEQGRVIRMNAPIVDSLVKSKANRESGGLEQFVRLVHRHPDSFHFKRGSDRKRLMDILASLETPPPNFDVYDLQQEQPTAADTQAPPVNAPQDIETYDVTISLKEIREAIDAATPILLTRDQALFYLRDRSAGWQERLLELTDLMIAHDMYIACENRKLDRLLLSARKELLKRYDRAEETFTASVSAPADDAMVLRAQTPLENGASSSIMTEEIQDVFSLTNEPLPQTTGTVMVKEHQPDADQQEFEFMEKFVLKADPIGTRATQADEAMREDIQPDSAQSEFPFMEKFTLTSDPLPLAIEQHETVSETTDPAQLEFEFMEKFILQPDPLPAVSPETENNAATLPPADAAQLELRFETEVVKTPEVLHSPRPSKRRRRSNPSKTVLKQQALNRFLSGSPIEPAVVDLSIKAPVVDTQPQPVIEEHVNTAEEAPVAGPQVAMDDDNNALGPATAIDVPAATPPTSGETTRVRLGAVTKLGSVTSMPHRTESNAATSPDAETTSGTDASPLTSEQELMERFLGQEEERLTKAIAELRAMLRSSPEETTNENDDDQKPKEPPAPTNGNSRASDTLGSTSAFSADAGSAPVPETVRATSSPTIAPLRIAAPSMTELLPKETARSAQDFLVGRTQEHAWAHKTPLSRFWLGVREKVSDLLLRGKELAEQAASNW